MAASIAVCMIVRDEEECLPCCLESLAGLGARLYVTDTGSRDRTREIALSFGARLRSFPWVADFSAARNHAIADVAEDWILNLDADEFFPEGEAARLPAFLKDSTKAALALNCEAEEGSSPARMVRLFRNHLGIRFQGIIHEYFRDSLKGLPAGAVGELPIRLKHSGYAPGAVERKLKRNLPLLEREWERCETAGDWSQKLYIGKKLAEAAFAMGDPDGAEKRLLGLLESMLGRGETHSGDWQATLLTHLLSHYHETGRDTEALSCCSRFEPVFGRHPLFWLYRGLSLLRAGSFGPALADLEEFDRFVQTGRLDLAVPLPLLGSELWNSQGVCQAALGRHEAAAALFAKAVAAAPENPEYQVRLKLALLSHPHGTDLGTQTGAQS